MVVSSETEAEDYSLDFFLITFPKEVYEHSYTCKNRQKETERKSVNTYSSYSNTWGECLGLFSFILVSYD